MTVTVLGVDVAAVMTEAYSVTVRVAGISDAATETAEAGCVTVTVAAAMDVATGTMVDMERVIVTVTGDASDAVTVATAGAALVIVMVLDACERVTGAALETVCRSCV